MIDIEKAKYLVDLHCHTTRSDGSDTPEELIEHAVNAGMQVIAITDHDMRPPKTINGIDAIEYAAARGLILLPGTEISCQTTVEDCHIVCLGCDWTDLFFEELENQAIQSKIEGYQQLVYGLKQLGYEITWDEVLENGGRSVKSEQVQKKMIFELLSRKGYFDTWSHAKIMVKQTPELSIQRKKPEPLEVIRQIHRCGGLAILAHPYLINEPVYLDGKTMSRTTYIDKLIEGGLDGIEVRYSYGKTSYSGTTPIEEIELEIRSRYEKRIRFFSGGSDYHADGKKGTKNPRQLGEYGLMKEEFVKIPELVGVANENRRVLNLKLMAAQCRCNILRMVRAGGHGHVGGALSAMDIITALYFDKMNVSPENIEDANRDRFLLSAGHKCLAQYAALAEKGYFDKKILDTYGALGSKIPGHPDMYKLPGVEANTGALGHGLSIATGMAMVAKLEKSEYNVYVVLGDGELPEGSNWEAAAAAAKFQLDNLVVFVDNNGLQISGAVTEVMNMTPIDEKFQSFGWGVTQIDGNDMQEIVKTLDNLPVELGKPTMILCNTVKAKGLSFGENNAAYHFWDATEEMLMLAETEMEAIVNELKQKVEAVTL